LTTPEDVANLAAMNPAEDFEGRRVLVTGGASGIGQATARLLGSRGAQVAVLDRDAPPESDTVLGLTADVTDDAAVSGAVREVVDAFGGLDVLVNNAGIGAQGTVEDNDLDEWRRVLDVNLLGMVRVTRAALPALRQSREPCVVNVCSIVATAGLPERALYSASKGAVLALTLAMAADHVGEGIRVNCVNPGTVDTPWVARLLDLQERPDAALTALQARQPTGRLVDMTEVAHAIAYLAGPHSGSVTGTALAVDGGMSGLRKPAPQPR
jgi:2-keto-3-deoxy-L-fuconate dehydrogenase